MWAYKRGITAVTIRDLIPQDSVINYTRVAELSHKIEVKNTMDEDKSSGYVPDVDDNGVRKTYPNPVIPETKPRTPVIKYPFKTVPIGEGFPVLYSDMKKTSLAPYVNKMSKKHGKKFVIVDQPEYNLWWVACVPMSEQTAIASGTGIVDTLNKMGEAPNFGFEKEKE